VLDLECPALLQEVADRVVIGGAAEAFRDPDGFAWEATAPATTA
jgi:fructose-specific component phosphotransferase system IIB-like protein